MSARIMAVYRALAIIRVQAIVIERDHSGGRSPVVPKMFPFRSPFDLASRDDAALLECMRGVSSHA